MISVVIPTKNRRAALERTLAALASQDGSDFEIVVVDNGSTDGTPQYVETIGETSAPPIRLVLEPKPGPAAARNRGVEASAGEVLLFLGDDTEPADETFVARHGAHHRARRESTFGVLGHIAWSTRIAVSPFMRWLEEGRQFAYGTLSAGPVSAAHHFYTSNVSIKRSLFDRAGGFEEAFRYAAVEDIELGVRLAQLGLELEYDPAIVAWHDHPTTLDDSLRRFARVGSSARIYNELHPDLGLAELPVPRRPATVRAIRPFARVVAAIGFPRPVRNLAWTLLHSASYADGYESDSVT